MEHLYRHYNLKALLLIIVSFSLCTLNFPVISLFAQQPENSLSENYSAPEVRIFDAYPGSYVLLPNSSIVCRLEEHPWNTAVRGLDLSTAEMLINGQEVPTTLYSFSTSPILYAELVYQPTQLFPLDSRQKVTCSVRNAVGLQGNDAKAFAVKREPPAPSSNMNINGTMNWNASWIDHWQGFATRNEEEGKYFNDIAGSKYEPFIERLLFRCGWTGYKSQDGTILHLFAPDKYISRAEFLKLVMQCGMGTHTRNVESPPFPDVPIDHWAARYIDEAKRNLLVIGNENNGFFEPDRIIKLGEASKLLIVSRIMSHGDDITIKDVFLTKSISCNHLSLAAWYYPYLSNLFSYPGISDNFSCDPGINLTRGQAAELISTLEYPISN